MSKINVKIKSPQITTLQGGTPAVRDSNESQLRRAVLSCLLWEDQHYEDGVSIANRIQELAAKIEPEKVAALAVEARHVYNLRHVPLLLLCVIAKTGSGIPKLVATTVERVVTRADEPGELLALYWKLNGAGKPIPNQFKKGLAWAIGKFDQYQLTKYNRDANVKIRDVVFLTHPRPDTYSKNKILSNLVNKDHYPQRTKGGYPVGTLLGSWEKLSPPDTWEVELSAGKDKKETWERLLSEGRLGYLALLRNLRNMVEVNVDYKLINDALLARKGADRVFPFRFFAAAKAAPKFEGVIDEAFLASFKQAPKLSGKTAVIIDVSGSMYGGAVSKNSDMTRAHAASALGAVAREICEFPVVYATAGSDGMRKHKTQLVPARRGMALADGIYDMCKPLGGGGIFLKQVMDYVYSEEGNVDRVIVITDEQDTSGGGEDAPSKTRIISPRNYLINVSSYQPSIVNEAKWHKIMGFSEGIFKYLLEYERAGLN